MLEANPDDAWMHRELGFLLVSQRRFARGLARGRNIAAAGAARRGRTYHLRAALFRREGRIAKAQESLRQALTQSIDNVYAAHELLDLSNSLAERREALGFIHEELKRQVIFGDGLLTFRELAHGTLDAAELLAVLQEAVRERPDLWHAWSAVALQLLNMDRLDEAWETIDKGTQRYPLLPRLWLDQATIARARGDDAEERRALETACQISPQWGLAVRSLCGYHERHGDLKASRRLLEQLVGFTPLDAANQVMLAETLWRLGEREAATQARSPRCRPRAGVPAGLGVPEPLDPRNELPRRGPGDGPRAYGAARRRGPLLAGGSPRLQPSRGTRFPLGRPRQGAQAQPGIVSRLSTCGPAAWPPPAAGTKPTRPAGRRSLRNTCRWNCGPAAPGSPPSTATAGGRSRDEAGRGRVAGDVRCLGKPSSMVP